MEMKENVSGCFFLNTVYLAVSVTVLMVILHTPTSYNILSGRSLHV